MNGILRDTSGPRRSIWFWLAAGIMILNTLIVWAIGERLGYMILASFLLNGTIVALIVSLVIPLRGVSRVLAIVALAFLCQLAVDAIPTWLATVDGPQRCLEERALHPDRLYLGPCPTTNTGFKYFFLNPFAIVIRGVILVTIVATVRSIRIRRLPKAGENDANVLYSS